MHIYLTYEQLKAAKAVMSHGDERVDWEVWEEFKRLILSTPLDVREDLPTIGEIHAS